MSESNGSVAAVSAPASPAAGAPEAAAAAAGGAGGPQNGQDVSTKTSFNSMADLKDKYPELYNRMMQGIAINICRDMQRAQTRLKQEMRRQY